MRVGQIQFSSDPTPYWADSGRQIRMASAAENQEKWMKALIGDIESARAKDVRVTDESLIVDLTDGRTCCWDGRRLWSNC